MVVLFVVLAAGHTLAQAGLVQGSLTAGSPVTTIDEAKKSPDGTPVTLEGVVTAAFFDGCYEGAGTPNSFAIQAANRSGGIRVIWPGAVSPGDRVLIQGVTATPAGTAERVIAASNVGLISTGNAISRALAMNNRISGGGVYGQQPAVTNDTTVVPPLMSGEMNNVGLLIKIWGLVTDVYDDLTYENSYFYIDDGAHLRDGTTDTFGQNHVGIRCRLTTNTVPLYLYPPRPGEYVFVTGVMGVNRVELPSPPYPANSTANARYVWTKVIEYARILP